MTSRHFDDEPLPIQSLAQAVDQERLAILAEALGEAKLIELCDAARQSILETAEELRRNWREDGPAAAARSAHRLLGVAANFGCTALAEISANIERTCLAGHDGRDLSADLEAALTATLASLPRQS